MQSAAPSARRFLSPAPPPHRASQGREMRLTGHGWGMPLVLWLLLQLHVVLMLLILVLHWICCFCFYLAFQMSSPVPVINNSNRSSLLLYKRQKLQKHLGLRGGILLLQDQQRLLLPQRQRRLVMQRETEQQQKLQKQRMKVGVKANKLQRAMLRETKCFL